MEHPEPEFIITVEEEIGRVRHSKSGDEPMLRVCFGMIADAVADRANGAPQQEFLFHVNVGEDVDRVEVKVKA